VRPRFVWGPGDTTVLPSIVDMVKAGKFAFIGGGRQRTSTTHVDNTVEGLILAADKGTPGAAYFVTDGEPIVFREWITKLLATRGVEAPGKSVPKPVAGALAAGGETLWKLLRRTEKPPPLTRMAYWVSSARSTTRPPGASSAMCRSSRASRASRTWESNQAKVAAQLVAARRVSFTSRTPGTGTLLPPVAASDPDPPNRACAPFARSQPLRRSPSSWPPLRLPTPSPG